MELKAICDILAERSEGKSGADAVTLEAGVVLAAQSQLERTAQMARDLEMARDEAQGMKPSVARKLNEKIRALEAELEELRSAKKVRELEKKVQFLEHELKQSYTTKNFTLKSGLLELEKQYRAEMNTNPPLEAFWDDIVVLLDEKKERHDGSSTPSTQLTKGPRGSVAAASSGGARTPRASATDPHAAAAVAAADGGPAPAADGEPAAAAASAGTPAAAAAAAAALTGDGSAIARTSSAVVQTHVEAFNTIISEETASAATAMPAEASHADKPVPSSEMVVRHGAGFRIVKSAGGAAAGAAAAAAGASGSDGSSSLAAAADSGVVHEQQQPVQLLRADVVSRMQELSFCAVPASLLARNTAAATTADQPDAAQQPPHVAAAAQDLSQQADAVADSISSVITLCASLSGGLPAPPVLPGSAGGKQQQQQAATGSVDASSLWQLQLERVLASVQQLKQAAAPASAEELRQQQAKTAVLLAYVGQLRGSLSSNDSSALQAQLALLQQELQQLQQLQQRALQEAGGQALLVAVFGQFVAQLEQQGVLTGAAAPAASDAQQQEQPRPLLQLLQGFLAANPQVPALLAAQLQPPAAAELLPPAAEVSTSAVQAVADQAHQQVQTAPPEGTHQQVQTAPPEGTHQAVQAAAEQAHAHVQAAAQQQHREVQWDPAVGPQSHAGVQVEPPPVPTGHVSMQTDEVRGPEVAHASTQAAAASKTAATQAAATLAAAATQMEQAGPPAAAQVQADLRPDVSHAASQADLQPDQQRQDVSAAAVAAAGQQPDSRQQRDSKSGGADDGAAMEGLAQELGQLRGDNQELSADLQASKSLVDHLNTNLKTAIDKADDAEAEAVQAKQQLHATAASLQQLHTEHAELTHALIDAKVLIAEKEGELLRLVRDLRRAIKTPAMGAAACRGPG